VAGDSGSFPGPDWMPKQAHMADLQADSIAVFKKQTRISLKNHGITKF